MARAGWLPSDVPDYGWALVLEQLQTDEDPIANRFYLSYEDLEGPKTMTLAFPCSLASLSQACTALRDIVYRTRPRLQCELRDPDQAAALGRHVARLAADNRLLRVSVDAPQGVNLAAFVQAACSWRQSAHEQPAAGQRLELLAPEPLDEACVQLLGRALPDLTQLRVLGPYRRGITSSFSTEGALRLLASSCPALQTLACVLPGNAALQLPALAALTGLHDLHARFDAPQNHTDMDVTPLAALTRLTSLHLHVCAKSRARCRLDAGQRFGKLAALQQLRMLHLGTAVTPPAARALLAALGALPQLESLHLHDLPGDCVPGAGAGALPEADGAMAEGAGRWCMPALRRLEVQVLQTLTLPSAAALVAGCPRLTYLRCRALTLSLRGDCSQQAAERVLCGLQALDTRGLGPRTLLVHELAADPWVLEAARQAAGALTVPAAGVGRVAGSSGKGGLRVRRVSRLFVHSASPILQEHMRWLVALLPQLESVTCGVAVVPALAELGGLRTVSLRRFGEADAREACRLLGSLCAPAGQPAIQVGGWRSTAGRDGEDVAQEQALFEDTRVELLRHGVELCVQYSASPHII